MNGRDLDELMPESPRDRNAWRRFVPLTVFLVALLLFDFALAVNWAEPGDILHWIVIPIVIGFSSAQILFVSVWTAWGPFVVFWRIATGGAWLSLATICACAFLQRRDYMEDGIYISGMLGAQFLLCLVPFAVVRAQGWRMTLDSSTSIVTRPERFQFGIRQLIFLTAVFALIFSVARLSFAELQWTRMSFSGGYIALHLFLALILVLLGLPVVYVAFVRRNVLCWLVVSTLTTMLILPLAVAGAFYLGADETEIVTALLLGHLLLAGLGLLLVRLAGIRLERFDKGV